MMRWWPVITALVISAYACMHRPTQVVDLPPARVNPLETAIVIELDVEDWIEVCVRVSPASVQHYRCLTVGNLRFVLEDRRNADWRPFQVTVRRY